MLDTNLLFYIRDMKIVLNRDVKNLGKVGELCEVANGYGRNFLIPKGYAIVANKQNIEKINKKIEELKAKNAETEKEATKIAEMLSKEVFNVVRQAADDDTIYGSIKNRDVFKMIEVFLTNNNIKFCFELGGIEIKEQIKSLGQYKISVNLFGNVATEIRLNVCRTNADFEDDVIEFDKKMQQKLTSNDVSKTSGVVSKLNDVVEKKQAKIAEKQAKAEAKKKAKVATKDKENTKSEEKEIKTETANTETKEEVVEEQK